MLITVYCVLSVVNDSLDDILGESGDEEEQDAIVTQVLDEIGIDISGKVCLSVCFSVSLCFFHCASSIVEL